MTETGWIIVGIIALAAILLVALVLRRKPTGALPGDAARGPIPGQVKPEPSVAPEPVATPAPHAAPQTIAAEEAPAMPAPAASAAEAIPTAPQPVAVEVEAPAAPVVAPESVIVSTPPAPAASPAAPIAASAGDGDNLLQLKGVGPKIATLLRGEGITRFAQIAAWTDADLAAIDAKLGSFSGRPKRDNWIDQSRFLAAGDVAGYEAKYGKL